MVNIKYQLVGLFKTLTIKKGSEPYMEVKFRYLSEKIGARDEFPFAKMLHKHLQEYGFDPSRTENFGSKDLNATTVSKFEIPCSITKSFHLTDPDGTIIDEHNKKAVIQKATVTIGKVENTIDLVMTIEMNDQIEKVIPTLIESPIILQFVPYIDDQTDIFEED